jgi:hypothetical protein
MAVILRALQLNNFGDAARSEKTLMGLTVYCNTNSFEDDKTQMQ